MYGRLTRSTPQTGRGKARAETRFTTPLVKKEDNEMGVIEDGWDKYLPPFKEKGDNVQQVTDHKFIAQECHDKGCQFLVLKDALRGMLELEKHTHRVPGTVNAEWVAGIVADAKEALGDLL